jgi:hypothetical protein
VLPGYELRQNNCELSAMETANSHFPRFMPWREEIDRLLLREYFIDLGMAGITDEYLLDHFEMNQTPADFVEWFATKYDLYDFKW